MASDNLDERLLSRSRGREPCGYCKDLKREHIATDSLKDEFRFDLYHVMKAGGITCPYCKLIVDAMREVDHLDELLHVRWKFRALHGLLLIGDHNGTKHTLEFYTTQDPRPEILPDSIQSSEHVVPIWDANDSFEKLHRYLRQRDTVQPNQLPTRVLDLGFDVEDEDDVRILEPDASLGPQLYAALSHCWQREDIESTKTLRGNIATRRDRLPFRELPGTFKQCAAFCRRMKVRYLWIDSLCIVQDEPADWEREAANMHNVYANAWFTIAMHGSTYGRMPHKDIRLTIGEASTVIHARHILPLLDVVEGKAMAPDVGRVEELAGNEHWTSVTQRGWCYQERALSTRMIHFTDYEFLYESRGSVKHCQCNQHWKTELGFAGTLTRALMAQGDTYRMWGLLLQQYTSRMFTRRSDLLPGFAGVAARFGERRELGRYVAGLWETDLIKYLCWRSREWVSARASSWACEECRPHPQRVEWTNYAPVPSWSWASRLGPCEMVYESWKLSAYTQVASIERVECLMEPKNPYLNVRPLDATAWPEDPCGRYLVVRGSLYSCVHISTRGRGHADIAGLGLCAKEYAWAVPAYHVQQWGSQWSTKEILEEARKCAKDYCIDAGDDLPPDGSTVYLLPLFQDFKAGAKLCLVLRDCWEKATDQVRSLEIMQGQENARWMERIGISMFNGDRFDLLEEEPNQVINLM